MRTLICFVPILLIACHHSEPPKGPEPAAGTVAAQIEQGKQLYVEKCARCHGDAGQGNAKAPPVVGKDVFPEKPRPGAKRDVDFHTAADVFAWTSKNMPGGEASSRPNVRRVT